MSATGPHNQRPASLDWNLLLVPLIGLVAAWPFLTQSLPSTDDGALHMLRLAEIDRCLRHGVLPLRWAPDFAHGYGYPFFNFYASLSSYIGEVWHLAGLDFPPAIAAATVTALFVSGWGAYLLGRDLAGRKGGLVAAAAYMYAPYQFYDSAYRGNLAESWALAFLPWVLWTGRRAVTTRRWRDVVPCALAYAALIYTHNVYALISSPLLGAYMLVLWWKQGRQWREAWRPVAAVGLGLAMSAFFWLPAFLEKQWTRFSTDLVDYRTFFLPLKELLSPPPQVDLSRLNAYPPRSLSWGMLALIGAGLILLLAAGWRARQSGRAVPARGRGAPAATVEWLFWAVVFLGASWMTVRSSDAIWRTVPLINFALIPWRYLGIASLAGSLLAGGAIALLPDPGTIRSPALAATGAAIVLLAATAVPWTYAAPFPQPESLGVDDIVGWEYSSRLIGTTAKNEYLPIWSTHLPAEPADPALLSEHDPIIARLDETTLPEGAVVTAADYGLLRAELVVRSPQAFRARYKQLFFPGWEVRVDGRAVPLIVTQPYGLIGFDVPAGEHRIVVRPVATPLRRLGEGISALALLGGCALWTLGRARSPAQVADGVQAASVGAPLAHWACVAFLAVGLLGLKEGVIDRTENLFRAHRFQTVEAGGDGHIPGVQVETRTNFGNLFTLYGYDLPAQPVAAGDPLRVDLYLSARQAIAPSEAGSGQYMAYARLVDDEGRLWSRPDNGQPEGFRPPPPTTIWPVDAYGHWAYLAYTLPGTPPGRYWIQIGLFERETWHGLNVLDDQGLIAGLSTRIGPVEIVRPRRPPDVTALDIERPSEREAAPDLEYLGSKQDLVSLHAGETLQLTLFWRALRQPGTDYRLQLAWVTAAGTLPLDDDLPLGRHEHPTSTWQAGEVVRSPHRLRVPAAAAEGPFRVEATLLDDEGCPAGSPVVVSDGVIESTERLMAVPASVQHRVDAALGEQVTLLGYDLVAPEAGARVKGGQSLPVTVYWQASREMEVSYKVFVQLVGPGGVLAQVDAIPVNWTRPTTGWIVGEVIVDPYTLSIPAGTSPGTYPLIAGMYDEGTLQRLAVRDAAGAPLGDHVVLAEIVVE